MSALAPLRPAVGFDSASSRQYALAPLLIEGAASTMALMAFVAIIGPIARLLLLAPWQVGLAVTMAGAAWMVLARVWGAMSDRYGRRRIMLFGLGGFALSYGLLCLFIAGALAFSAPALVAFVGIVIFRTCAGAFYAAVPATSVALIADHYPPEQRAQAIASLGAANGLGMVLGPATAGLLAQSGLTAPLLFIVALPVLAFAIIWRVLPRDAGKRPKTAPLRLLDHRLCQPLAIALVAMMCVAIAQISVGFYAIDRLQLTPLAGARAAGLSLAAVGAALVGAQILVRSLKWPERRLIQSGALISGLGFGLAIFAVNEALLVLAYFIGAAGMGFVFPAFYALAANAVEPHEQGAAAGAISSVQGLGAILGPIAGTLIYAADIRAPYVLIALLLTATALLVGRKAPPARPARPADMRI